MSFDLCLGIGYPFFIVICAHGEAACKSRKEHDICTAE